MYRKIEELLKKLNILFPHTLVTIDNKRGYYGTGTTRRFVEVDLYIGDPGEHIPFKSLNLLIDYYNEKFKDMSKFKVVKPIKE